VKKRKTAEAETEAQRLVRRLLKGKRPEELAIELRVSVNTIYRWRRGVTPQPGHLDFMRDLARYRSKAA